MRGEAPKILQPTFIATVACGPGSSSIEIVRAKPHLWTAAYRNPHHALLRSPCPGILSPQLCHSRRCQAQILVADSRGCLPAFREQFGDLRNNAWRAPNVGVCRYRYRHVNGACIFSAPMILSSWSPVVLVFCVADGPRNCAIHSLVCFVLDEEDDSIANERRKLKD